MKIPKLSLEESKHIENGGRVFLIKEIPGPLWKVLSISNEGVKTLIKPMIPKPLEGYSDLETAKNLAIGIANLSEDNPIVRVCLTSSKELCKS